MPEIITNLAENAPYYGAAIGALGGAGYDLLTQRRLESGRRAPDEAAADITSKYQLTRGQRIGRTLISAVLVGGVGAGVGLAWGETQAPSAGKAELMVAADRSGSTAGEQADEITRAIQMIEGHEDIDAQAVNSYLGVNPTTSLSEAASITPSGYSDMGQATLAGIDTFKLPQQDSHGGKSGLLVLTANGLGAPGNIISEDESLPSPVPIYIVNVDKPASSSEIANEQQIAKATGGKFLQNPTSGDFSKMIGSLEPPKSEPKNNTPEGQKWLITVLALGSIGAFARWRRHLPLSLSGMSRRFMSNPKRIK